MTTLPSLAGVGVSAGIPNAPSPTPAVFSQPDERRLLTAVVYAEAEANENDMRRILGEIINRARLKGQNVFDIVAAPNQYVPTLSQKDREAKYLPYLRGEIPPGNLRIALMAENIVDEFMDGKFVPPTKDVAHRGRNGVNVYPPELQKETRFPTGNAANLAPLPALTGIGTGKKEPEPTPEPEKQVNVKTESVFDTVSRLYGKLAKLW